MIIDRSLAERWSQSAQATGAGSELHALLGKLEGLTIGRSWFPVFVELTDGTEVGVISTLKEAAERYNQTPPA